jgi:hypothetical protein
MGISELKSRSERLVTGLLKKAVKPNLSGGGGGGW